MSNQSKTNSFACKQCRASKRRCDGAQPQCSTCTKAQKDCEYNTEKKPRKRKYWDENYVKSLENQVQALLALQSKKDTACPSNRAEDRDESSQASVYGDQDYSNISPGDTNSDDNSIHQSNTAMEEMSVMMWRTNLADAVTIHDAETKTDTDVVPGEMSSWTPWEISPQISAICGDYDRIYELGSLFLENINQEHQFTMCESANFLHSSHQGLDRLLLHAAMLAAGATFDNQSDSIELSDRFAELSESLVFKCFRTSPSIYVIQALVILSWRSLALGHDHFGWTFLSMAAGMAVHLRLHVLALGEFDAGSSQSGIAEMQTFWSFYMTDRTSISILGRNCMLPWRRVNVPPVEKLFPSETATLAQLSFAWQCRLWYMHDQRMDEIFSSSFDGLNIDDQAHLLLSTQEDLDKFLRSHDPKLNLARATNPKPVLLFHMSYQMAILLTMPPFLRLFAKKKEKSPETAKLMTVVLQSLTSAATSMLRLIQEYCKGYGFQKANPLIIHHLLSASIVHLMNTTTKSPSFRRYSTTSIRKCLYLLSRLGRHWTTRSQKSIKVIKDLASRWKVKSALPNELDSISHQDVFGVDVSTAINPDGSQISTIQPDQAVPDLLDLECLPYTLLEPEIQSLRQDPLHNGEQSISDLAAMDSSFLGHEDMDLFQIFEEFRKNVQQEPHWPHGI